MRLERKRVLITGAARGIGYGIAQIFLREGAKLVLLDKREEELKRTSEKLKGTGSLEQKQVDYVVCDLSDSLQLEKAAKSAWECYGGLDILINNAGIATREGFLDLSLETWEQVIDVNLKATFHLSQWIAKRMVGAGIKGSIVNMSSKNGLAGSSMLAHYNASKGGVQMLTQSMAVELAPHQIRVNAVAPGFIDTPLDRELKEAEPDLSLTARTPMKRLGTIEEAANAFLFLASDEASYITGTTIVVDGGHLANASEL